MKHRKKIIAAVLVCFGLGMGIAFAHGGWRKHRMDPAKVEQKVNKKLERGLDWLDATPAQRTTALEVKARLFPQFMALRAQHAELRAFALQNLTAEKPDAKAIHAEIDARIDAIRALAHETADGLLEVHGTLTPEQRAQIAEKINRRHRK